MSDFNHTATRLLTEKRDTLLAERSALLERRNSLLNRLRMVDRELQDCKAASRLFGISLEFPPERRDDSLLEREVEMRALVDRERMLSERHRVMAEREAVVARAAAIAAAEAGRRNELAHSSPSPAPAKEPLVERQVLPSPSPSESEKRPTIRELVLIRLSKLGVEGSKAATIREYVERTLGEGVHEKTVGMTLYRLLKEKLVRREGHVWFSVPPSAETGNPGVSAPGPINSESEER